MVDVLQISRLLEAIEHAENLVSWKARNYLTTWDFERFPNAAAKLALIDVAPAELWRLRKPCGPTIETLIITKRLASGTYWDLLKSFTNLKTIIVWLASTADVLAPDRVEGIEQMPHGLTVSLDQPTFALDPADFEFARKAAEASPIGEFECYFERQGPPESVEVTLWKAVDGKVKIKILETGFGIGRGV